MSVDQYLDRRYNRQTYDCLVFADEVWFDLTGDRIKDKLATLFGRVADRYLQKEHLSSFAKLERPEDPCLVLFRRPRTIPHVGVYIRGRVLHITDQGVEYQPLEIASRSFTSARFYQCRK